MDVERLCHSSRLVTATKDEVVANAESSRQRLAELRAILHSAVDSRISELESLLVAAVSSKSIALDSQLVVIDAALERLHAIHARHEPTSSSSDIVIATRPAVLPDIRVEANTAQILDAIAHFGALIAPPVVTSRDIIVHPPPSTVRPGSTIAISLRLGPDYPPQDESGTAAALASLENGLIVEASLLPPNETSSFGVGSGESVRPEVVSTLPVLFVRDFSRRGVVVTLSVPPETAVGSKVEIKRLEVAGQAVVSNVLRVDVVQARRFWRLRFTESSDTGWEAYLSNLKFHGPSGAPTTALVVRCWNRAEIDPFDGVTRLHPEYALRRTRGYDGAYRTMYSPGVNGDFVAVELASPEDICGVSFDQFAGPGNAVTAMVLEGSADGEDWAEILRSPVVHGKRFRAALTVGEVVHAPSTSTVTEMD